MKDLLKIFRSDEHDDIPSLSAREAQILRILLNNNRDMFGLAIVKASDGEISRGTIYVTLGRMEDKGFVESYQEEKAPEAIGLPRRYYKPTGLGMRVYQAMELSSNELAQAMEGV